ncbi:transcriptional regulator [Longispora fulva]|nr:transcriptional regulator [Longispora fulva]
MRPEPPARQDSLRTRNLALVLRHIADAPKPLSRAELAAATGLTKATVSTIVDTLVEARLVGELEPRLTRPTGRPAIGLVLDGGAAAGLGLEINVDYLAACVVDLAGVVRHREVVQDDQRGRTPERTCAALADLAARAIDVATGLGLTVAGAGVGVPGLVDGPAGVLRFAPNLGWRDTDVRALLSRVPRLGGLPITLDNEANLAALGELYADPSAPPDFIHVSGEIGVGAGIVVRRELFHGTRGWSGEIGHVAVDMDGPACGCGAHGCLEQRAGQEAILRAAGLSGAAVTSMGGQATVGRIVAAAERGDARTLAALRDAGRALGVVVAGAVNLFDIPAVVLGGIYAPLAPWIAPQVRREVDLRVLWAAWSPVEVRVSTAGADAAVLGAAGSVTHAILREPADWMRRRAQVGGPAR